MLSPSVVATVIWIGCSTSCARRSPRSGRRPARRRAAGRPRARSVSARKKNSSESVDPSICGVERRVDREREVALDARELADRAVVHPEPAPWRNGWQFVSWTAVPVEARMWAKIERRGDMGGDVAEIAVVPGRLGAVEDAGRVADAVPADPEPVAVRGRRAEPRVLALVDQRVRGLEAAPRAARASPSRRASDTCAASVRRDDHRVYGGEREARAGSHRPSMRSGRPRS